MPKIRWQPEAESRLRKVPFFVRPFVKKRVEAVAAERGLDEVSPSLIDEIKGREHQA